MNCKNIYAIGVPKSGGTSLWAWLEESTVLEAYKHDAPLGQNLIEDIAPYQGRIWSGGLFWMINFLQDRDPDGIEILSVRRDLFDWAWSFWTHFYVHDKWGISRVMALYPVLMNPAGEEMADGEGVIVDDEFECTHGIRTANTAAAELKLFRNIKADLNRGAFTMPLPSPYLMEPLIYAYVKRQIQLAKEASLKENRCVINIDHGLTPPGALKDWLLERLPGEAIIDRHDASSLWPHKRKTSQAEFNEAHTSNCKKLIRGFCLPYEEVWQREVLSRVLTS